MRRRINPWVVALSAALTFGSLMAFVGPRSYGPFRNGHLRNHWFHDRSYGYHHGPCDDDRQEPYHRNGSGADSRTSAPEADSIQ